MEIKLNLIPPDRKEKIIKDNHIKTVIELEIALAAVLIVFCSVLLSFRYILNLNLISNSSAQEERQKTDQFKKIKDYDDQFSQVNSQLSKIMMVKKDQLYWSYFFSKLNSLVFAGIDITSLSASDYSIVVSGYSNTREDLILFKEKLEKDDCFLNVNLPLSNLVDKNNIQFEIVFDVNKDCLKQK